MRFMVGLGIVVAIAFAALGAPVSWRLMVRLLEHDRMSAMHIVLGCAGGAAAGVLGRWVPGLRFLDTLCHELSHATWAFLVGGSVDSLHASANDGGHTRSVLPRSFQSLRAFLVTIAPYWFCPLIPLVVVWLLAVEPLRGDALLASAAAFGFLIVQPLLQWGVGQSDLRAYRFIAPIAVAGCLLTGVFTLGLGALAAGGSRGFQAVYVASFRTAGVHDPERLVRRAGASLAGLAHPAWLGVVRAASSAVAGGKSTKSSGGDTALAGKPAKAK
jgi:hypothetical protein